jgi:GNAT superfamily N-acetyltransferase
VETRNGVGRNPNLNDRTFPNFSVPRFFMPTILHRFYSCLLLIYRRQLFLLLQLVSETVIPQKVFAAKKYLFYRRDQQQQTSKNVSRFKNIDIFAGTESDVGKMVDALYEGKSKSLDFYNEFYRNGIEPWMASSNETILGVVWLYTGSYLLNWEGYDAWLLQIEVEPTAKFVANVFVRPEYRGQKIFPAIAGQCFDIYSENQFYSCIEESNLPSIKSHEKIGFRQCASVYCIRLFQRTYCFFVNKKDRNRTERSCFRLQRGKPIFVSLSNVISEK